MLESWRSFCKGERVNVLVVESLSYAGEGSDVKSIGEGIGDDERIGELELDIAIDGDSVGTYRLTSKIGAIRTIADGDI